MTDTAVQGAHNPLREALQLVLGFQDEYIDLNIGPMKKRGALIRDRIPQILGSWLADSGWETKGKDGSGRRSRIPWVRVYDRSFSPTPEKGWYVVYLFAFDGSKAVLSVGHSTAEVQEVRTKSGNRLRKKVEWARDKLRPHLDANPRLVEDFDLADPGGRGDGYQGASAAAIVYEAQNIPEDEQLHDDLVQMLKMLRVLHNAEGSTSSPLEVQPPPLTSLPPAAADPKMDFDWLVERTLCTPEDLEEVIDTLHNRRPQIVLAGPPGTSKTWVAESLALYLTEGRDDAVHVVQFHPTYAYEDFVEGLRPAAGTGGSIAFAVVEGVLVQAADQARGVDHPVVLVIDEMNRANLPSVFGELFYLLEYRDKEIRLLQRSGFSLPNNLYIIGTMNTADRSIRSIDTALRRRFDIFECPPSTEILNAYYKSSSGVPAVHDLSDGMELLNIQLEEHLDRHHAIGHTFFMGEDFDRAHLQRTWDRQVKPLIDEYFFDQPDIAESFSIENFWPE